MDKHDRATLNYLTKDSRLSWIERRIIKDALAYIKKLEDEKSWASPYRQAISVLENAERAHQGSFS